MATYVIGIVLAALFGLACRHVYNNYKSGKHDCCGTDCGCGCGCSCTSKK